jgi:hypothetical protein
MSSPLIERGSEEKRKEKYLMQRRSLQRAITELTGTIKELAGTKALRRYKRQVRYIGRKTENHR